MAGNERILADAPVVGDQVKVAVADAAVGDGDLHLLRTQLAGVVAIGQQFRSRRVYCKSLNLGHVREERGDCGQSCGNMHDRLNFVNFSHQHVLLGLDVIE
jgi:hypothetical protein